jgi:hypothetical protein
MGEPKNCGALICLRPERGRSLAAAVTLRPQCPCRPGKRTNGYLGGLTFAVSIITRHTSQSRTMTQPKYSPVGLPAASPELKGISPAAKTASLEVTFARLVLPPGQMAGVNPAVRLIV